MPSYKIDHLTKHFDNYEKREMTPTTSKIWNICCMLILAIQGQTITKNTITISKSRYIAERSTIVFINC